MANNAADATGANAAGRVTLWDPLNALPRARRWLWLALAVLAVATAGPSFINTLRPAPTRVVDFFRNWAAARALLEGRPIYGSQDGEIERHLGQKRNPADQTHVELFTHPPPSVFLSLPFARLDYRDAALAWNLVSLGALALVLWRIAVALGVEMSLWSICPVLTLSLLCIPLRDQLHQGQLNLVLLVLVAEAWLAERSGRPLLAGILIGTATAVKLFPGFLVIYFVARRQWRSAIAAIASFFVINGVTVALLGAQSYVDFFRDVVPHLGRCQELGFNMSLFGFWKRLFDPGSEPILPIWQSAALATAGSYLSCLIIAVSTMIVVRRARLQPEVDRVFAAAVTGMLLVTPVVWNHYLVLLVVPLAIVWVQLPALTHMRAFFLFIIVCLWVHPMVWWQILVAPGFGEIILPVHALTVLSMSSYVLLALFVFAAVRPTVRATT